MSNGQRDMLILLPREFSGSERNNARNEERHRHIIDANLDVFAGKRVLDLACFNGRWSFAALKAGASFVTGVEGREDSIAAGRDIFQKYGVPESYELICSDMFDYLFAAKPGNFDTVLCLGVYYHILDHYMLLRLMTRLKPQTIIIDSGFIRSFRNYVHVHSEAPALAKNALPKFGGQSAELVGEVSLGLAIQMAWNLGYSCRPVIWNRKEVRDRQCVKDYMSGKRFTLRLDAMTGHSDRGWQKSWSKALSALSPRFVNLLDPEKHDAVMDQRCSTTGEFSVMKENLDAATSREPAAISDTARISFPQTGLQFVGRILGLLPRSVRPAAKGRPPVRRL